MKIFCRTPNSPENMPRSASDWYKTLKSWKSHFSSAYSTRKEAQGQVMDKLKRKCITKVLLSLSLKLKLLARLFDFLFVFLIYKTFQNTSGPL